VNEENSKTFTASGWRRLYDNFLMDCHQANKRLTPEDWEWFGCELHHVDIPACEGGELTPLNSQPLTLVQHWKAGVLQSEVWGRKCFAFVPAGVLPQFFEELRKKWDASQLSSEHQSLASQCVKPETRSENGRRMGVSNRGKKKASWTPSRREKTVASLTGKSKTDEHNAAVADGVKKLWETRKAVWWVSPSGETRFVPVEEAPEGWQRGRVWRPVHELAQDPVSGPPDLV
jgi:hypothetical protein